MATTETGRENRHALVVVLSFALAIFNLYLALFFPFIITIPPALAGTAVGFYAARRTRHTQRRLAASASIVSAVVLIASLLVAANFG